MRSSLKVVSVAFCAFLLLLSASLSVAQDDVLFEVGAATASSPSWGRITPTTVHRIAQEYTPSESQRIAVVRHVIEGWRASDSVVLTLYEGGAQPEAGLSIASVSVVSSVLPASGYAEFRFEEPVLLNAGTTYWFVWSRSSPVYDHSSGYISGYRGSNQSDNTQYWQYEGYAFTGGAGWKSYSSREWSLRLEGEVVPARTPVILIPGLFGTHLDLVSGGSRERLWLDTFRVWNITDDGFLNGLAVDSDGTSVESIVPATILRSGAFSDYYGELLQRLEAAGFEEGKDLFTFPYDWRLDIRDTANRLSEFID